MKETESIQTVDTNIKIPFWKAACFGLGDFGNNFVWTFVGSYLMIFYTDVFGTVSYTHLTLPTICSV